MRIFKSLLIVSSMLAGVGAQAQPLELGQAERLLSRGANYAEALEMLGEHRASLPFLPIRAGAAEVNETTQQMRVVYFYTTDAGVVLDAAGELTANVKQERGEVSAVGSVSYQRIQ